MFALVESGSITKMLNGNRGITIGDIQHPRAIFTLWTEAERNAIVSILFRLMNLKRKIKNCIFWFLYTFSKPRNRG